MEITQYIPSKFTMTIPDFKLQSFLDVSFSISYCPIYPYTLIFPPELLGRSFPRLVLHIPLLSISRVTILVKIHALVLGFCFNILVDLVDPQSFSLALAISSVADTSS